MHIFNCTSRITFSSSFKEEEEEGEEEEVGRREGRRREDGERYKSLRKKCHSDD